MKTILVSSVVAMFGCLSLVARSAAVSSLLLVRKRLAPEFTSDWNTRGGTGGGGGPGEEGGREGGREEGGQGSGEGGEKGAGEGGRVEGEDKEMKREHSL